MLGVLLALSTSWCQTPPSTDEKPDVRSILEQMGRAVESIRSGEYDVSRFGMGNLMEERVPRLRGHVIFQPLPKGDPVGAKLAIRGGYEDGATNPFHLVYDGQTCAIRFEKDDVLFKARPAEDRNILKREEIKLALEELYSIERIQYAVHPTNARYEERRDVGGTPCLVVMVEFESETSRALPPESLDRKVFRYRFFIGEADGLPRRIEYKLIKIPDIRGEQAEAGVVMELTNLKINGELPADAFNLPPDSRKAEASAASSEGQQVTEDGKEGQGEKKKRDRLNVGDPAPGWELQDLQGAKRTLAEFKGKVVLMDFWATWCKPCLMAAPVLEALRAKYKDKPFALVGINVEADPGPARRMLEGKGSGYPHMVQAQLLMRDYRINGLPAFVIVGADGNIAYKDTGFGPNLAATLSRVIDAELAKIVPAKAASPATEKASPP